MKYIGSGLWAIAGAYLIANGFGFDGVLFSGAGFLIAFFGSNKSLITINNTTTLNKEDR